MAIDDVPCVVQIQKNDVGQEDRSKRLKNALLTHVIPPWFSIMPLPARLFYRRIPIPPAIVCRHC